MNNVNVNGFVLSSGHPFGGRIVSIGRSNNTNHIRQHIDGRQTKRCANETSNPNTASFRNITNGTNNSLLNVAANRNSINGNTNSNNNINNSNNNKNNNSNGNNGNGSPTKCTWCDQPRARNDLCNRCRQKVESRARRLVEQKISGDCFVIQKIIKFIQQHLNLQSLSFETFFKILKEIFPLLVEYLYCVYIVIILYCIVFMHNVKFFKYVLSSFDVFFCFVFVLS